MNKNTMSKDLNSKYNKGFSLVELIVVIAIMVVLVAVLAPVFTKYVESSRRATDVQNANQIASAVMADVADDNSATKVGAYREVVAGEPSTITETPRAVGDAVSEGSTFTYYIAKGASSCAVYIGDDRTYNLANASQAANYKNADSAE